MTLEEGLQHIYSIVNKDQSGNTYNINRYNNDLLVANIEMFSWYYGLPQGYQPGMPLPAVSADITKKVTDSLRHLLVNMGGNDSSDPGPLVVNSSGIATIPSDYVHVDYMNYTYIDKACGGKKTHPTIDELTGPQWSNRRNSLILNDNNRKYPYCNFQHNYIQFMPEDIGYINFCYWRAPKKPVYDYYITAQRKVIYLPPGTAHNLQAGEVGSDGQTSGQVYSKSVELEWPEDVHPDFFNLILTYVGVNLRSPDVEGYSQNRKTSGI